MKQQCKNIESLDGKRDYFSLHKKVKETAGLNRPKKAGLLTDNKGNMILDIEEIKTTGKITLRRPSKITETIIH